MDFEKLIERMKEESRNRPKKEYKCDECRDQGYIRIDTDTYKRCKCEVERIAAERLSRQGFKAGEMVLKDFRVDDEISLKMRSTAMNFVKNYPSGDSMAVMGQIGSGKTHLVVGMAQELMNAGHDVSYMPYIDMLMQLRQSIFNAEEYRRIMNDVKGAGLLVIDDFLKGNLMPNDLSIIFELINFRYLNKKPVIISSEKTLNEIVLIDEALGSRIFEMTRSYQIQVIRDKNKNRRFI